MQFLIKCDDYDIGPFLTRGNAERWLTNLEDTFPEFYENHNPFSVHTLDSPDSLLRYIGRVS